MWHTIHDPNYVWSVGPIDLIWDCPSLRSCFLLASFLYIHEDFTSTEYTNLANKVAIWYGFASVFCFQKRDLAPW